MDRPLEAARYPSIKCEVDRLTDNGGGGYRASARLMVHGQTRVVEAELSLAARSPGHVVIEGEHVFDTREFGVSPPRLVVLKVDPVVRVRVRTEARSG